MGFVLIDTNEQFLCFTGKGNLTVKALWQIAF